jgi:translation machinery-associated protein 16
MATSKSLHKVQKQISKKRSGKTNSLHENSRDSQRLRRAGAREDKIARIVAAASRANQNYGEDSHETIADPSTDTC